MQDINTTVSHRWFQDVWNNGNQDAIDNYLTENTIAHGLGDEGKSVGIPAFKAFYEGFRNEYKDIQVDVERVIVEDNYESALNHVTATNVSTGKKVAFTGICMARIENGKIAEAWNAYDFLKMYVQAGYKLEMEKADA